MRGIVNIALGWKEEGINVLEKFNDDVMKLGIGDNSIIVSENSGNTSTAENLRRKKARILS